LAGEAAAASCDADILTGEAAADEVDVSSTVGGKMLG
jgi:hypothetical protein